MDPLDERLRSDLAFDDVYDERIRALSSQHWTPVAIAARAARLLTLAGATRIVDVGSGAGKFCIVGALSTRAELVGVERRADLVAVARAAALRMGAARATFVHANVEAFPFDGFDGVYLYNPFFEHISRHLPLVDRHVVRSGRALRRIVHMLEEKLRAMPAPVVVVTYHGFGGRLPPAYSHVGDEPAGNDRLALWIKRRA
ncbi:MAG TPA: class I SAM-dependent methyltransferase [Polyangia bacterium]|jgi:SAM-dependent methyltransferase|nr:class I SAM-dependent methyltransferase [Polyangia bacterium]